MIAAFDAGGLRGVVGPIANGPVVVFRSCVTQGTVKFHLYADTLPFVDRRCRETCVQADDRQSLLPLHGAVGLEGEAHRGDGDGDEQSGNKQTLDCRAIPSAQESQWHLGVEPLAKHVHLAPPGRLGNSNGEGCRRQLLHLATANNRRNGCPLADGERGWQQCCHRSSGLCLDVFRSEIIFPSFHNVPAECGRENLIRVAPSGHTSSVLGRTGSGGRHGA